MNTFLVVHSKDPMIEARSLVDIEKAKRFVVVRPQGFNQVHKQNVAILSWLVNERSSRAYVDNSEFGVLVYDGLPFLPGENGRLRKLCLADVVAKGAESCFSKLVGEYSLAVSIEGNTSVTSNIGGSHPIYWVETKDFVAFSNRAALFFAVRGVDMEINQEALEQISYQGYVGSYLTPFGNVRKLLPGSRVSVSSDGVVVLCESKYADIVDHSTTEEFSKNPTSAFESVFANVKEYVRRYQEECENLPISLGLSGGKDSRLMLALLRGAGADSLHVWTRGPAYSHDVVPAKEITSILALRDHELRRPSASPAPKVSAQTIVNCLNYHEGQLSLYDFQGVSDNHFIVATGHQTGLRPGSFERCDLSSFDSFLRDACSVRTHDPLRVQVPVVRSRNLELYKEFFVALRDQGVPVAELPDQYYLRQRMPSWASVFINSDHYSGPQLSPLITAITYRFILSVPKKVRDYEIFHLMGIALHEPRLIDVPFGNQAWRPGIQKAVDDLGLGVKVRPRIPYRSHRSFPNLANPYISNIKISYAEGLRPVVTDLMKRHRGYFSRFLDLERLEECGKAIRGLNFPQLYVLLGIYGSVLLKEYGMSLYDINDRASVVTDLKDRIEKGGAV